MSQLEVNKIIPQSGTTLTIGDSGDTISFASGVLPSLESLTITGDLTVDTNTLYVDSTNNRVGVGTSSPSYNLEVTMNSTDRVRFGEIDIFKSITGSASQEALIQKVSTGSNFVIGSPESIYMAIDTNNDQTNRGFIVQKDSNIAGGGTELFRVNEDGNVGIGTTSPARTIELSNSNPGVRLTDTDGPYVGEITQSGLSTFLQTQTSGGNIVFRTDTASEAMRIDSSGNVGIGTSSPTKKLQVNGNGFFISSTSLQIEVDDANGPVISQRTSSADTLFIRSFGNIELEADSNNNSSQSIIFKEGGSEAMRITAAGRIGINSTNPDFRFICNENRTDFMARFFNDGNTDTRKGIIIQCGSDSGAGTNRPLTFRDGNGTTVGEITFTGGTVTYGSFTAHHPCFLPEGITEYPYGTLLEIVSIFNREQNGVTYERGIRYNVQKTQSENSKSVLGAYSGPMATEEEPDAHQVYVLGDGHILCNNSGGNISIGDGICSSSTAGIGKKATDNPSMIIGIAQENVTFENDTETKLVAVQYGLQQFIPWGN